MIAESAAAARLLYSHEIRFLVPKETSVCLRCNVVMLCSFHILPLGLSNLMRQITTCSHDFNLYRFLLLVHRGTVVQIVGFYCFIEEPWFLRQNERWLRKRGKASSKRGGGMAVPMVSVRLPEIELVGSYI